VERSTPSEKLKETADRAGAGNVEAPAPTGRESYLRIVAPETTKHKPGIQSLFNIAQ
jgi:hypothetical protein